MKYLLEHNILIPAKVTDFEKGMIIRRVGNGKDQQGVFVCTDDADGIILVNVIDMVSIAFEAEAGILRPQENDLLYVFKKSFGANNASETARDILFQWPLYKQNEELKKPMRHFMEHAFAPEQIVDFEKSSNLKYLFVPIQQKFKIGRFAEKIDWKAKRKELFKWQLDNLEKGEHITYVAMIPQVSTFDPLFYSLGTQPHESTTISLQSEPFNFKPTHGGHIKCTGENEETKQFIVDTGSTFLGKGIKSMLSTAEDVVKALKKVYRNYTFKAVEGRGAF